jgi:hypothetical protein
VVKRFTSYLVRGRHDPLPLHAIAGVAADDPVLAHLDSQIRWYDDNSKRSMTAHFRLRSAQILVAAVIPVTQVFLDGVPARITAGVLAALVAVVQGIDSLHHYGDHYVSWRATTQQLWRERFLFAAGAGAYKSAVPPQGPTALALLAERVDAVESQENHQWHDLQLKDTAGGTTQR